MTYNQLFMSIIYSPTLPGTLCSCHSEPILPWTTCPQANALSSLPRMAFPRCLSFADSPPPGNLPNPGIEPGSPVLLADSLPSEIPGKPYSSGYELVFHCGFNLHFPDGYSDVEHLSEAYEPFIYLLWGTTYSSPLPI